MSILSRIASNWKWLIAKKWEGLSLLVVPGKPNVVGTRENASYPGTGFAGLPPRNSRNFILPALNHAYYRIDNRIKLGTVSLAPANESAARVLTVFSNAFRESATFHLSEPLHKKFEFQTRDLIRRPVHAQKAGAVREFVTCASKLSIELFMVRLGGTRPAQGCFGGRLARLPRKNLT